MRRQEKRKRFYEAVLQTLYPPPSPPQSAEDDEKKPVITTEKAVNVNPDDFEESKSGSSRSDEEDDGSQPESDRKLSRAQRKRLRKKKLKGDALRRGKIIGPLLPLSENDVVDPLQAEPQGVRENAAQEEVAPSKKPGDNQGGSSSKKKLKQRRIAKRLAREGLKSIETENSDQDNECEDTLSKEKCDHHKELKSSEMESINQDHMGSFELK